MKQFINATKAVGISITEASPIDDRLNIDSLSAIVALLTGNPSIAEVPYIGTMYDGMVLQMADSRREYIWIESADGVIPGGFKYPSYFDDIQGHNYADKTYNLVLFDATNKLTLVYSDVNDDGILIPRSALPLQVLKDMQSAIVNLKSSSSSYELLEYPDKIEIRSEGLMVILDPKPALNESFKITIS